MRRTAVLATLWLAVSPAWAGAAWAADAEAAWRVTPDPARVGDRIQAVLEVTHEPGALVEWGDDPAFADLEPAAQVTFPADSVAGDREVTRRRFSLYADLPGEYRLPKTVMTVTGPAGPQQVTAAEFPLSVGGAFDPAHPPERVAPARGTVALPFPWGKVLAAVLLLMALAGAGVWATRRFRPQPAPARPAPACRPPAHRVALDRLKQLERAQPDPRATVLALSDIARGYLAAGFGIDAPTQTSVETGAHIAARNDPRLAPVSEWLATWDLVRFARREPSAEEARQALLAVREWVRKTAPQAPPAKGDAA